MKHYYLKLLFTALLLLCATVVSAHDFEVDGIYYNVLSEEDKTVEVTFEGYYADYSNEYTGSAVIPENVTYGGTTYSVTSIGWSAFYGCTGLTSIEIPNSVTSIGGYAFYGCTGLTNIEIPGSVTSIGGGAFYGCTGLTSIVIPNSVTSIGEQAFENCLNVETLYIGNSVESIGWGAFKNCEKIKEIKIGLEKPISCSVHFADVIYDSAILYVPIGTKSLYQEVDPWYLFLDIREMDFTGIEDVLAEVVDERKGENGKVKAIYDLQGRMVEVPSKGLYIINGKKVLIK